MYGGVSTEQQGVQNCTRLHTLPYDYRSPGQRVRRRDAADDTANTAGAKGLGEPVIIPTAAAIANAIYNATGIRVTETPMSPVRLVSALKDRKEVHS